jgi:hypothetical protein
MLVGAPMNSQEASVLVGGVHARYADSVFGTAGMTTLRLSGFSPNAAGTVTGSLSKFSSGEWVTQTSAFGTALLPMGGGVSLGVSAGADANRIQGGSWNGQTSGGLLGVLNSHRTLVTAGASLGAARTVYDATINTRVFSGRVQQRIGQWSAFSGGVTAVSTDTVRYADITLELNLSGAMLRASVAAGMRTGDLGDDPWGQGHLEYDFLPRLTYELTLGRYPQSLVGFTDGLYLTTGIRLRLAGSSRTPTAPKRPVEVAVSDGNRVRITLKYSGEAEILEIAGVWNGWLPVSLARESNNRWSAELNLEPGIYKYAIVVNGGEWTVPDGVPSEPDDFGGEVATLVVQADGR